MRVFSRRLIRAPQFWIVALFAISRVLYFAAGVRFDARPLNSFFQIADPLLLKTRLFETLFYLHTQPPAFNLIIGVALKLFPSAYVAALHAFYIACGVTLCFTIYRLQRILGIRESLAAVLTTIFLISPGVALFENFLLYEYPLTALLCASAVLFARLIRRPGPAVAAGFFGCLVVTLYMRALFHPVWLVLIALFTVWLARGRRAPVASVAAVAVLLAAALCAKNQAIAGSFTTSTWLGFNIESLTLHQLTPEEHERLIRNGVLDPMSRISTFEPIETFHGLVPMPPPSGIPVLDQSRDSTGRINYNNAGYLKLHPFYIREGKAVLLHYPRAYLRAFVTAWFTYFLPTGDFTFFDLNRPHIERLDRFFNIVFFGQWKDASDRKALRRILAEGHGAELPLFTGTWLLFGLPALFVWGLFTAWRMPWTQANKALLLYLLFQIAFITAVVNLLSPFENNRYRLPLDPFFLALLGMAIERIIRRFRPAGA